MIVNANHEVSIIGKMENSAFCFYLTGSRFFGDFSYASDWDYFVQSDEKVRKFLKELGFFPITMDGAEKYSDATIVDVFQAEDAYRTIQVQLVHNAILKNQAQDFLQTYGRLDIVPKESRKYLWNMAIFAVSSGEVKPFQSLHDFMEK
jgi:hypothetical protein